MQFIRALALILAVAALLLAVLDTSRSRDWKPGRRFAWTLDQFRAAGDAGMAKFFRRGKTKIFWMPACADLDSPTRAEIAASLDLSPVIADVNGFDINNTPIETPNLADRYTTTIPGEDKTSASSFVIYDDDTSTAVRTAIAKGTAGFVLMLPYGDVPTKRCEVWPATVTGLNDLITTGNEAARANAGFAITAVPEQEAVVPAAA